MQNNAIALFITAEVAEGRGGGRGAGERMVSKDIDEMLCPSNLLLTRDGR